MPYFDEPGVRWDDPLVRYDDPRTYQEILNGLNPTPTAMAYDVVLDIDDLPVPELLTRAHAIKAGTAAHADFASLAAKLATLQTWIDSTTDQQDVIATCEAATRAAVVVRNTRDIPGLKGSLKELAQDIGRLATTEGAVLATTLRAKAKPGPKPVPDRPTGLELSYGDEPGELSGQCDGQPGLVKIYEIRITTSDPNGPDPGWQYVEPSGKSTFELSGLPSGQMVWVSVRACNAQGKSAWSDPASKRVP